MITLILLFIRTLWEVHRIADYTLAIQWAVKDKIIHFEMILKCSAKKCIYFDLTLTQCELYLVLIAVPVSFMITSAPVIVDSPTTKCKRTTQIIFAGS